MCEKVTVIIPAYNHPKWLSESLNSVLGQTYPNVEIIVVRPVSTNDSSFTDVLNQYADKVIYCETENTNCFIMMNEALKIATGGFVARLDEGDIFLPEKIELQVKVFEENPDVGLIFTAYQVIGEDGNIRYIRYMPGFTEQDVLFVSLYGPILGKSTAMIRRECYHHVGVYKDSLVEEYDMWLRLARHYKVGVINKPLVKQRSRPVDNQPKERIRKDAQRAIAESVASIPLEEIFPCLQSRAENPLTQSSAYAARGVILMNYGFYESAKADFAKAHQICPDASIHQMWMGILSRRVKDYQTALNHFARIPRGDRFYLDAQWAIRLTSFSQKASTEDQGRLSAYLANEYNNLLQITLDFATGKLSDLASLSSDIAEEIQLYLGWDILRVSEALFKGTKIIADEWNRKSPKTPNDIINFYKETENYIFDLAWWHREFERKNLTKAAINICKRENLRKVLDFGCGIGQDGILFAEASFEVTLADLPGKTFDFAKWRVERRGLKIKLVNSNELSEKYDAILCFDVLEHLWEPREIVEYLYNHLSVNGILLVTANFEYSEVHPMHIERNVKYLGRKFFKMMSKVGFRMERWGRTPLVFRKSDVKGK